MARPLTQRETASAVGLVVLAACLTVVYATPRDSYWSADCGNKALLAERLLETRFADLNFDYPAASVDPSGNHFPIRSPYVRGRGDGFVSTYPPAYSALSVPFLALLGRPGLRLPAALGVAASALLFVLWLTPVVGRRWAAVGGLGLGLATPLFFYGTTVWEHSLTVALSLAGWLILRRPSTVRLLGAGWLTALACWFREELVLMGLMLAIACTLRWPRPSLLRPLAAGAVLPIVALALFNLAAFDSPLGPHLTSHIQPASVIVALLSLLLALAAVAILRLHRPPPAAVNAVGLGTAALIAVYGLAYEPPWLGQALRYLRRAAGALSAEGLTGGEALFFGLAAASALAIGFAAARSGRNLGRATWIALAIGVGIWALGFARIHLAAESPLFGLGRYNGLMVQLPAFCVAGLGMALVWRLEEYESLRIGVAAGLLYLVFATGLGVVMKATTGVHWGPRVLLPAAPAIVALAIVAARYSLGLARRARATSHAVSDPVPAMAPIRAARLAWAALALAGVPSSAHSTWFLFQQKSEGQRLQETVRSLPQPFVVTQDPMLAQELAAIWRQKPTLYAKGRKDLEDIARRLRERVANGFVYLAPAGSPLLAGIPGTSCRLASRHRGRHLQYLDVDLQTCSFSGSSVGAHSP